MFSNHNSCFEKLDRRCNLINKLSLCPFFYLKISATVYVNLCRYFNFRLFERAHRIQSLKYLRFSICCCKNMGIGKSKFMAKTQFLFSSVFNSRTISFMTFMNGFEKYCTSKNVMQNVRVLKLTKLHLN